MIKSKKHYLMFLILLSSILSQATLSQTKVNPADKYKDAYKKYINAECPIPKDSIKHFVYFARNREAIKNHPFLKNKRFMGAQIMYPWKELETKKGKYDFSIIMEDYEYLKSHGKKLFIQLQDATFNPKYNAVPEYLLTEEYDGGAVLELNDNGKPSGWVAKRWNQKVRKRFASLLKALGGLFDGKIEGINLQETSIGQSEKVDSTYSPEKYLEGIKENMLALKNAFPKSTTMQYANFMPGEWLPWENKGYLQTIYKYGEEIGVGLGGPDLMVKRRGQQNHLIKMMHEHKYSVPLGIAVQDGNYIGETGDYDDYKDSNGKKVHKNIVPMLYAFAKDFLKVNYMFWVDQKPYFEEDVLPCFSSE